MFPSHLRNAFVGFRPVQCIASARQKRVKEMKHRKHLILPQQGHSSGIGKDRKLTAAKSKLLCSLTARTAPPLSTLIRSLPYQRHDPFVNCLTT